MINRFTSERQIVYHTTTKHTKSFFSKYTLSLQETGRTFRDKGEGEVNIETYQIKYLPYTCANKQIKKNTYTRQTRRKHTISNINDRQNIIGTKGAPPWNGQ